jgi:hypothetical protein
VPLTFPSAEWFQALSSIANEDEGFQKFGTLEAIVAFKVGERAFNVTFSVREAKDVREISLEEMRDADFVIDLTPAQWQAMIEDIKANGQAGRDHTLNSLDLDGDDPIHYNVSEDGYRADKFFRYNPSLQRFMDNASQLDTVFDLAPSTA